MRITLGESPAGVSAHFHHGAAVSAFWEAAVTLCIDQAVGKDKTVASCLGGKGNVEKRPRSHNRIRGRTRLT